MKNWYDPANFAKISEKLIDDPGPITLKFLDSFFPLMIPFNSPHGFRLKSIKEDSVNGILPFKKRNLNHVKAIHACAMATLGEYCAGILLIRNFSYSQYRIILSKLEVEYFYQGKTDLGGEVSLSHDDKERVKRELGESGVTLITMVTHIQDKAQTPVAAVKSHWQLKSWEKVRTKV